MSHRPWLPPPALPQVAPRAPTRKGFDLTVEPAQARIRYQVPERVGVTIAVEISHHDEIAVVGGQFPDIAELSPARPSSQGQVEEVPRARTKASHQLKEAAMESRPDPPLREAFRPAGLKSPPLE